MGLASAAGRTFEALTVAERAAWLSGKEIADFTPEAWRLAQREAILGAARKATEAAAREAAAAAAKQGATAEAKAAAAAAEEAAAKSKKVAEEAARQARVAAAAKETAESAAAALRRQALQKELGDLGAQQLVTRARASAAAKAAEQLKTVAPEISSGLAKGGPAATQAIRQAAQETITILESATKGSVAASDKLGTIMAAMGKSREMAMAYIENLGPRLRSVLGEGATNFIELGRRAGSALAYYKWTIGIFLLLGLAVPYALQKAIDYEEAKSRNSNIQTSVQGECDSYCLPIGFDQYLGKKVTRENLSNPKDVASLSECFKDDNTCFPTQARLQKKFGTSIKNLPNYYCTVADLDTCDTKCAAACASQYPGSRSGSGSSEDDAWLPDPEPPTKKPTDYTPYIIAGVVLLLILLVVVFLN